MALRGNNRTTIFDVAEKAGVAFKTVSRVVNNEANVKDKTRQRVLAAIKDLNYSPNPAARGLAGKKSFLIGLLYDNPSPYYMNSVQLGALATCRAAGFHLLVEIFPSESRNAAKKALSTITQTRLDGVILTPPVSDNRAICAALMREKIAHVIIAPPQTRRDVSAVEIDNRRAAYEMTKYLLSLGHKRIAFILGHPAHGAASTRLDGYLDALKEHRIRPDKSLIKQGYFSFESGFESAAGLLRLRRAPTAIFAANDDMAAGAIAAAHRAGLSVPADLSVAGFDDTPVASVTWPALTTVRQPIVEMATAAADILLAEIGSGKNMRASRFFNYEIVLRGSTAPARMRQQLRPKL